MTLEALRERPLDEGPDLTVEFHHIGPICLLSLCGALRAGSVSVLEAQFDRLGRTPCRRVVVDVSDVTGIDTTGARVLLGLRYYVQARGGQLTVIGASPWVGAALAAEEARNG